MTININEQKFTGRVTADPELVTVLINGENVVKTTVGFGIKTERGDDAGFINITLWRERAQKFAELVKKGMLLYVTTTMKSTYDSSKKQTYFDFTVDSWQFVEPREKNDAIRAKSAAAHQQPANQGYPQQQANQGYPQQQANQGYPQQPANQGYPQQPAANVYSQPANMYNDVPNEYSHPFQQPAANQGYQQPTANQGYQQPAANQGGYTAGSQPSPFNN